MQDSTEEREARHDARKRQIAAEVEAYRASARRGGEDDSLFCLIARAVAGEDGNAADFAIAALTELGDDLEMLHFALHQHDIEDVAVEARVAWRLAERARAVAEIANRKSAIDREESARADRSPS